MTGFVKNYCSSGVCFGLLLYLLGYYFYLLGYYSYVSGTSLNVKDNNLIPPLPGASVAWRIAYMLGC